MTGLNRNARSLIATLGILVIGVGAVGGVMAQQSAPLTYDRVNLTAEARRQVANDEMVVVMAAEQSGLSPAELADGINVNMKWALEQAQSVTQVQAETRAYQSYPRYDNGRVVGWQASQELVLRTQDNVALTELVGKLQTRLLVRAMQFQLTPDTRRSTEDALISEAIEAFERRATLIGKSMQERAYRIVEMTINTGGAGAFRQPITRAMRTQSAEMIEAPATTAGTSDIVVTVSGTIEFQLP